MGESQKTHALGDDDDDDNNNNDDNNDAAAASSSSLQTSVDTRKVTKTKRRSERKKDGKGETVTNQEKKGKNRNTIKNQFHFWLAKWGGFGSSDDDDDDDDDDREEAGYYINTFGGRKKKKRSKKNK